MTKETKEILDKIKEEGDVIKFVYREHLCLILRHGTMKHLCGYVNLKEGSRFLYTEYDGIDIKVHGGLTFSGSPHPEFPGQWIGFDCGHFGDLIPGMLTRMPAAFHIPEEVYRDVDYVTTEIKSMVDQLIELEILVA